MGINIALLVYANAGPDNSIKQYYQKNAFTVCLFNVLVCMIVRNEVFHYYLTHLFVNVGLQSCSVPHFFKQSFVGVMLHLGGLHSSCGLSSLM